MANAPFNETPVLASTQVVVNSGSIDTTTLDHLRQGISVRNPRDFFDGTIPKLNYIFDNLVFETNGFGNPKQHVDGVAFVDVPGYSLELLGDESQSTLHPAEVDVSLNDPAANDGVIEPFELRDAIMHKSTFEQSPTRIRGSRDNGNADSYGDTDDIVYEIEQSVFNPFKDAQDSFGVSIQGLTAATQRSIFAFNDSNIDARDNIFANVDIGSDMAMTMSLLYVNASGAFVGDSPGIAHAGFHHRSIGYGSDYAAGRNTRLRPSNVERITTIESLAFGDKQTYARRGFIQQIDSLTPTRPLTLRTTDERRLGNTAVQFDDTKILMFITGTTIDVGRGTNSGDTYLASLLPTAAPSGTVKQYPFVGQSPFDTFRDNSIPMITAPGAVRPGVGDNWLALRPLTTELAPYIAFDETRLYDDLANVFFMSSSNDPIEVFRTSARDKTQIVIELPADPASVFFTTGVLGVVHSGLTYYNKDLNRWEAVATASVDYLSPTASTRAASALAFMPSDMTTQTVPESFKQSGRITTDAGFPFATKFDATGSSLIDMSDYIQHPFLLERCYVSLNLTFSPILGLTATMAPRVQQFFIMNQYDVPGPSVTVELAGDVAVQGAITHTINKLKDVVGIGCISRVDEQWDPVVQNTHSRDLTIAVDRATAILVGYSGSYVLPVNVCAQPIVGINNQSSMTCAHRRFVRDGSAVAEKNVFGGVQNTLLMSPRSFIQNVPHTISSTLIISSGTIIEAIPSSSFAPVPYLLMPTDKLVFGFANQSVSTSAVYNETSIANERVTIGNCRVRFVGSFIRDDKEFHFGLNQQLNTENISEVIGEAASLDQHILYPSALYSGTYIDDIIEGSFLNGNRGIVASHVTVQGCRSASLGRSVQLNDASQFVYDSLLPSPADIHLADGFKFIIRGGTDGAMIVGNPNATYPLTFSAGFTDFADNVWARSYPFESKYADVSRNVNVAQLDKLILDVATGKFVPLSLLYITSSNYYGISDPTPNAGFLALIALDTNIASYPAAAHSFYSFYYGTGPLGGLPEGRIDDDGITLRYRPRPRGTKYGIYKPLPSSFNAYFRADTFGQFRDMLEQRKYTRMFDNNKNQLLGSAVKIIFSGTINQSSNRDVFATSSLPYFDGIARN